MELKKKLERKRFRMKDENGNYIASISAISVVTQPAIEKNFQLFNSAIPTRKEFFKVTNEERMEITGPAMVPDQEILRQEESGEYYYCFFTKEDVRDYRNWFMQFANTRQANFEHKDNFTEDLFISESWEVTDPLNDKSAALGFKDITPGTWFVTYKTDNPERWAKIKESNLAGFSVEITLEEFNKKNIEEEDIEDIVEDLFLSRTEKLNAIKDIASFHSFITVGELSFKDYPQAAIDNAKRALEWYAANPDKSCGNKLMWTRAKQIANNQPLSYSNLKRISLNAKHESKANASTYEEGCMKIMWDAYGGTDLVYWSTNKLQQIDSLISQEVEKKTPKPNKTWGLN